MAFFDYRDGIFHAEDVPLPRIAEAVGTPVHVYSAAAVRHAAHGFSAALAPLPVARRAFAVKANPNIAVLRLLAECGYGADIVSGGELAHAIAAGMKPQDIVFSGVGKTDREMVQALDAGIGQFNLELEEEGQVLSDLARARGVRAPVVLRVNPDVDAGTHAKIATGQRETKFGVPIDAAPAIYARLAHIAGPICETGDSFARGREIDVVRRGDLAVFHTTGAYGAAMASTYNCRAVSPQLLVDGDEYRIVGARGTVIDRAA